MNSNDRYEITVDVDDDAIMDELEAGEEPADPLAALHASVAVRKGRGFSNPSRHYAGLANLDSHDQSQLPSSVTSFALPSGGIVAERSVEGWTVFALGIHPESTEDDVREYFSDHGRVKDVKMALDHKTGYAKGYAIVEFREYREARAVVDALDGQPYMGAPVKVDFCFVKSPMQLE